MRVGENGPFKEVTRVLKNNREAGPARLDS